MAFSTKIKGNHHLQGNVQVYNASGSLFDRLQWEGGGLSRGADAAGEPGGSLARALGGEALGRGVQECTEVDPREPTKIRGFMNPHFGLQQPIVGEKWTS